MQTKNAIGNLINRYRAVLKKCNLLNTFGTLAIASAMVLGGANLAAAADGAEQADWKGENGVVTIKDGESWKVSNVFGDLAPDVQAGGAKNIEATVINLEKGASLELENARLKRYTYAVDKLEDPELYATMTVNVKDGSTLTLTRNDAADLTSIDANIVNIEGGTVNLTGNANDGSSTANGRAYIGAYKGLNISGGNITLNQSSQIFAGGANGLQFTGGTVTLKGGSGTDANIQMGGLDNAISGTAKIDVQGYGSMTLGKNLELKGGSIAVAGSGNLKFIDGTEENTVNQTGGAVSVAASGSLDASAVENWNIAGGTVTVENGAAKFEFAQNTVVSGGTLADNRTATTISDKTLDITDGLASFESLTISGTGGTPDKEGIVIADGISKDGKSGLVVSGTTTVSANGTLALRGSQDWEQISKAGVNMNGGNLAVQDVLTMTASGGNIGVANGTLQADKINIKGVEDKGESDKVTVNQGKLITHHGFDGLAGIEAIAVSNGAELQFGEDIESDAEKAFFGTEIAGGTIEQDIQASGKVYIENGIWKFQDIIADSTANFDMKGGDVTVKTLALNTNNSSVYSATLRADKVSLGTGSMTVSGFDNTYNGRGELHTKNLVLGNTGNLVIADNGLVNIVDGTIEQKNSGKIQINGGRLEADYEDLVSNSALNGVIDSSSTGGFLYLDNDNKGYTLDDITKIQGNNKFGVSISGQLNDGKGNAIHKINTDDLGKLTNGGILQNVTLNAEGKAVSFTGQDKILGVQNVVLGDQAMTVGDGSNTSTVVIGSDLTGGDKASVDVKDNSVLSFENFGQAGSGTIGVAVSGDGSMTTNGDYIATKAINIGGLDVAGSLTAAEITMNGNGTLSVGSETSSGKLVADRVELAGGSLLIDPAWGMASSEVAIEKLGDQAGAKEDEIILSVDGKIGVGQNSLLSVGVKDQTELYKALDFLGEKGLSEEGIKAAMYLGQSVTVKDGNAVLINGTLMNNGFINSSSGAFDSGQYSTYEDKVTVADGLLAVNAQGLQKDDGSVNGAAIKFEATSGELKIDANGQVLIMNAKEGKVDLVDGTSATVSGTNVDVANHLLDVTNVGTDGVVTIAYDEKNDVVGNLSGNLGSYLKDYVTSGEHNAFLEAALSQQGVSGAQVANSVESAAKAPMVIGTATTALGIAGQGADYAMARTSFAPRVAGAAAVAENGEYTNISAGDNMANGMNLWIMPMYQNNSADGFKSGLYEVAYDSDFYGVALGADYTWANSFRLGATLNMGTGSAESKGTAVYTENDYDSVGFGVYAGYMLGNLGLSADVNYTNVSNEITQNNVMALSADGDSEVWSVGARAEYKIATSAMDIIPHIGIRYSHVSMDDMNFGHFATEADNANVWQLPVGVTFARDFATESGWNVKPSLDLAVIPAFGDTEMVQKARFAGVSGFASTETEIMDDVSGRAQLGIEASKGNFYMGLDYSYQGSSSMDSHGVQANFGFKF